MRSFRRNFHHLQDLLKRTDIRDHAILMLLAMYGVHSEEVARLRLSDVDWERDRIVFTRSKGAGRHEFPLHPAV
jgi:integrase/recombinase XerD